MKIRLELILHYPDTLDDVEFVPPREEDIVYVVRNGISRELGERHGPFHPDKVDVKAMPAKSSTDRS